MAKVTLHDVAAALRAAGLAHIGGGSKNTYWGLPGQKSGVGYFAKTTARKVFLSHRRRRGYQGIEDAVVDHMFYGEVDSAAALAERVAAWLKEKAAATQVEQTVDFQWRELRRTLRVDTLDPALLEDYAVGALALGNIDEKDFEALLEHAQRPTQTTRAAVGWLFM